MSPEGNISYYASFIHQLLAVRLPGVKAELMTRHVPNAFAEEIVLEVYDARHMRVIASATIRVGSRELIHTPPMMEHLIRKMVDEVTRLIMAEGVKALERRASRRKNIIQLVLS